MKIKEMKVKWSHLATKQKLNDKEREKEKKKCG